MNNLNKNIRVENITSQPINITHQGSGFDYTSDVWTVDVPRMEETYQIDFNEYFKDSEKGQKQIAKAYLYSICSIYENTLSYSGSKAGLQDQCSRIKNLFVVAHTYYPNKNLKELSALELVHVVSMNVDKSLGARGTIGLRVTVMNAIYDLRYTALSSVDDKYLPSIKVPHDWDEVALKHFAPEGLDTSDWLAGGSFNKVPFEVSLALLCYCLEVFNSDMTKYVLAFSKWQKEFQKKPLDSNHVRRFYEEFGKGNRHANAWFLKQLDEEYFECLQHYYPEAQTPSDLPYYGHNNGPIPFTFSSSIAKRDGKFSFQNRVANLVAACYVAMLILTGARKSELNSVRTDGIKKHNDYYIFYSSIDKTNHGVEKPRTIGAFLIPEILKIMDDVSYEPLNSPNRDTLFGYSLMAASGERTSPRTRATEWVHKKLSSFYDEFLNTDGQHLREICDHINPHGFRHTWVEFAMRRFDGNIMPLIMDRLAHSGQHTLTFTPAYTDNKISKSEYQKLGKEWMFEIVSRYVEDQDAHMVYGAVGDKIRSLVDDMQILDLQNRYERDERVREVVELVAPNSTLKPSMTNICCLNEGKQQSAQCYDKKIGVAMTSTAKPSQCSVCENGLLCQSQIPQFELTLKEYEERYQQHQLGALANKLRAEANEDNPFGAVFAEQADKDFRAMKSMKQKIDKIRGSK